MNYSILVSELPQDRDGLLFDVGSLYARLQTIPDQRQRRGIRYSLAFILVAVLLAKLAGQDKPKGIAEWVRLRKDFFITLFKLQRPAMPHAVTYERLLETGVDAADVEQLGREFLTSLPHAGQSVQIAFDGKTLRGVFAPDPACKLHLLAAYLPTEGLVLFQVAVDSKTNEITAAPELLKALNLQGKIVTGDALHTQRNTSQLIGEAGGDYLWIAKENQPNLHGDIAQLFQPEKCLPATSPVINDLRSVSVSEKNRGRLERRTLTTSSLLAETTDWPYLTQVFRLERVIQNLQTNHVSTKVVYGLTSLTAAEATPPRLLEIIRAHWGIESGLHYRRDVTLHEDQLHSKRTSLGRVMACLNNLIIGLVSRLGLTNLAQARRQFDAHPDEAFKLLISCAI
jgi:predicted transposase YbfD/YdcC